MDKYFSVVFEITDKEKFKEFSKSLTESLANESEIHGCFVNYDNLLIMNLDYVLTCAREIEFVKDQHRVYSCVVNKRGRILGRNDEQS